MNLISIDPGKKSSGIAVFENDILIDCCLQQSPSLFNILLPSISNVVIEKPQIYKQQLWKGDPNDLVEVAIVVGKYIQLFEECDIVETVYPRLWKGQRPKAVDNNYTLSILSDGERDIFNNVDIPRHLQHNIIDAIGIGLWKLGRR